MNWTKQQIIDEVCETMDYSFDEESNVYKDNNGIWSDRSIEELIYDEVDEMDNYYQDKKTAQWIIDFCNAAKRLFNMGNCLDDFIEDYSEMLMED